MKHIGTNKDATVNKYIKGNRRGRKIEKEKKD
jgi:hypothetical protein